MLTCIKKENWEKYKLSFDLAAIEESYENIRYKSLTFYQEEDDLGIYYLCVIKTIKGFYVAIVARNFPTQSPWLQILVNNESKNKNEILDEILLGLDLKRDALYWINPDI